MQAWVDYFERLAEHNAARARARETLLSLLNAKQRESLEQGLGFDVTVNNHVYRIRPGNTVQRLDPSGSFPLVTLCVLPSSEKGEELPEDDVALTQKLLLEADEEAFLAVAIRGR